jgi:hypothetical protein
LAAKASQGGKFTLLGASSKKGEEELKKLKEKRKY